VYQGAVVDVFLTVKVALVDLVYLAAVLVVERQAIAQVMLVVEFTLVVVVVALLQPVLQEEAI
jgi:hypothetical protein